MKNNLEKKHANIIGNAMYKSRKKEFSKDCCQMCVHYETIQIYANKAFCKRIGKDIDKNSSKCLGFCDSKTCEACNKKGCTYNASIDLLQRDFW